MLVSSPLGAGAPRTGPEALSAGGAWWLRFTGGQQCAPLGRILESAGELLNRWDTCSHCKTTKSDLWGWEPALALLRAPRWVSECAQR